MTIMLYNDDEWKGGPIMTTMTTWTSPRRGRQKRKKLCLWHKFVLLIGYLTLAYAAVRGIIYVLVLLGGIAG